MGGVPISRIDGQHGAIPAATLFPASSHLLRPAGEFPAQCATVWFARFPEVSQQSSLGGAFL